MKLLTHRYPLYYSWTVGVHYGHNCPLCRAAPEMLAHFLLACPVLASVRQPHLLKLQTVIVDDCFHPPITDEELVGTIMDPSTRHKDPYCTGVSNHESITRDMCFAIHSKRSTHLGYTSRYISTFKSGPNLLQGHQ